VKSIAIFALFVTIVLIFPPAAKAQNGDYRFSIKTQAGILWGTSYEIVYANSQDMTYLSELQWKTNPLWYGGLAAAFAPAEPFSRIGFFAELGLKVGVPVKTGVMEDRDWFPKADPPGALTHFSSHENRSTFALLADLRLGVSFPVSRNFFLKLSVDPSYMFFGFEAWNGYYQYGQYDRNDPNSNKSNGNYDKGTDADCLPWRQDWYKTKISGMGISYDQHWFLVSPRGEAILKLGRFTLSAALALSPFTFCYAIDNHALRDMIVEDAMMMGLFIEPKGSVLFALNGAISLGIEAGYRHISGMRGNTKYTQNGVETPWVENVAGAGYRVFEGAVVLRWAL
jgi:outer membrane protease